MVLSGSSTAVGLPFFVLATSAPLLQKWFFSHQAQQRADPYFLYGASNAGSLAALLLYPTAVEPVLPLTGQAHAWTAGYAVAAALSAACAVLVWRSSLAPRQPEVDVVGDVSAPIRPGRRLMWVALASVPSSLMLAVTAYITADIGPCLSVDGTDSPCTSLRSSQRQSP